MAEAAVFVVGLNLEIGKGFRAAFPVAILLFPLTLRSLRQYRFATTFVALSVVAAGWGLVLSQRSALDHQINSSIRVQMIGVLLSGVAGFVLVVWARAQMRLARVVMLYGAGGVAAGIMNGQFSWKHGLALPMTFFVLGLIEQRRTKWFVPAVVAVGLGLIGALGDYRSYFGLILLAAILAVWQALPRASGRRMRRWLPALLIAGLGVAIYFLAVAVLTAGYLGEETQARTAQQIEQTGSLIAGGRPQWAATIALMKLQPGGYGVGVVPNLADIQAAKKGLSTINVELEPHSMQYLFGTSFSLHSITADLWARYGVVGVAMAVVIFVALVRSLSFRIAERRAQASVTFVALLALWSVFFQPTYLYWVHLCVGLGILLIARGRRLSDIARSPVV